MITTALTEMFDLRHPIVLGAMGGVAGGRLAAAVSNTGGPGLVGGDYGDTMMVWAGEVADLIGQVEDAATLVERIGAEAESRLLSVTALTRSPHPA